MEASATMLSNCKLKVFIYRVVSPIWACHRNMIKKKIYGKLKFKDLKLSNKQYILLKRLNQTLKLQYPAVY